MRKSRIWLLAMAMVCGIPLPIEEDKIRETSSFSESGTNADKERERDELDRSLSFNAIEIGQIRTDAMEECFGKRLPYGSQT